MKKNKESGVKDTPITKEAGFYGETELNENGSMTGTYVLMPGIVFAYSAYDQTRGNPSGSPPRYVVRGSVRLLDAAGHVFQSKAYPTLTAASPTSDDNLESDDSPSSKPTLRSHQQKKTVNVKMKDGSVICEAIIEKARALYKENAAYLTPEIEKVKPVSELCLAMLFNLHLNRYFSMLIERGIAVSESARHTRELLIKKVASSAVGLLPLGSITERSLKKLRNTIGKTWRAYFKETAEFVNYLYVRKQDSKPKNAFLDYLNAHSGEKKQRENAERLQKNAADSGILIPEMDREFFEAVKTNIGDGGMMGAAIVRSTGFNSKLSCDLKWEQVKWLDEEHSQALIRFYQPDKAGRVQNYSFLLSPLWSSVFRLREQWLIEHGYQGENAPEYVAGAVNDPVKKLQPKELTTICRELAHRYDVSYATLTGLKELKRGAGIRVFQETRHHSLEEAGMKNDPGLLLFYLHESLIGSTQANHYRSLSGDLAQHTASVYLARADLSLTDAVLNTNRITRTPNDDGGEIVIVRSPDSHSKVQGIIKVHLKKGDVARFFGTNGARVRAKAVPETSPDKK